MSYMEDKLWVESKKVAKDSGQSDNWLEIVEHYHSLGGFRVMVHSIMDEKQREILHILDDSSILLIDSRDILHIADYDEVMSSKKLFFYKTTEKYTNKTLRLPEDATYSGKTTVTVKVV